MAWMESIVIRGGYLQGSVIGISDIMATPTLPATVGGLNNGGTNTIQSSEPYYYNSDLEKQIDVSSYFTLGHADFSDECFADIAILDGNTLTGYFSLYATRSGLRVEVMGKVKNASGVVIGTFAPTAGVINIDSRVNPTCYLCFCKTESDGKTYYGLYFNLNQRWLYMGRDYSMACFAGAYINDDDIYDYWGIAGHVQGKGKKKSPQFGPEGEEGGYGPTDPGSGSTGGSGGPAPTFDGTSDPWVDTPIKPGVLSFGLLNLYKCDNGALNLLGSTLFPSISKPPAPPQTGVTDWVKWSGEVAEWIGDIIFTLSDSIWNKDLIDYIVSVHLIPVDVTGGNMEDIKIGPRTMTGILARPITEDVVEFDCGTVHVDEYYTNYVDYMTRCRVFIPFYGFVTIKPEYWQSADISLKYLWNVMDGSFVAKLYSTVTRHQVPFTSIIGQYSGCACVHMPLSGANYASMFSQLTGAGAGIAMSAASGNVAVAASSALALSGMNTGGEMQSSNAYNASSAFYGHATPYLIIERPVSHFSTRYVTEQGLPLIMTMRIGDCSGLTICDNPILNFACSDEEAKEIKAALKEGVIV